MKNFVISKNATKLTKRNFKSSTFNEKTPPNINNDVVKCKVTFFKKRQKMHQKPSEN